jgi:hypothetical protein
MVEKGLETFWKNIEACFVPNVVACNCLVNGLSKLGIHRNDYTFNIMAHVLCRDGEYR